MRHTIKTGFHRSRPRVAADGRVCQAADTRRRTDTTAAGDHRSASRDARSGAHRFALTTRCRFLHSRHWQTTSATNRTLDDLNRNSPLKPVFFSVDSADLDEAGRATTSANAELLKKNPRWVVTIEGHCDERGTAEYNLALGERRAIAVKTFLVSLGIPPDRVRTISYGKEFPFDPAKTDEAFSKNRRGHFVITSN